MMSIQGIGQYGGLYQSYKMPSIPSVSVDEIEQSKTAGQNQNVNDQEETLQSTRPEVLSESVMSRGNSDLQDISLVFNKNDNFDYLGKDSEIGNLDVQKAVSDMKKDQILQEYQYFVGDLFSNESNNANNGQDGLVFLK